MRRGGGVSHPSHPPHPGPSIPTSNGLPFPQCAQEALMQISKHVRLSGHNRNRSVLAQASEWQTLLDNDLFNLNQDRRNTKLSGLQQLGLLNVLSQFFVDKAEDPNKNAYFEVIFLGRENDSSLHDHRISVLFNFAAFAIQYPVLQIYMLISQWLAKLPPTSERMYADRLVRMLVDLYIRQGGSKKLHEFLFPLEDTCPEFTVYFITYAPRSMTINRPMEAVLSSFISRNSHYAVNQFRDTPHLAKEFAREVFPKLLKHVLDSPSDTESETVELSTGLMLIISRWNMKVKDVELDIDYLFERNLPFTRRRCDFFITVMAGSESRFYKTKQRMRGLKVPVVYFDLIKLLEREVKAQDEHASKRKSTAMES